MTNTEITKGQRVIVKSLVGEETATVESVEGRQYGPAATRVTLVMDDRTRYSCPLRDIRPVANGLRQMPSTKAELATTYERANARHMAAAAAIGAIYPTKDCALEAEFNASHEARRLAFLAWVAAR